MSLIACGSIHEGNKWFSDDSRGRQEMFMCLAALFMRAGFADSRMKVPRYRSESYFMRSFFLLSVFSSSEVLAKITSIRSKLTTAACWCGGNQERKP